MAQYFDIGFRETCYPHFHRPHVDPSQHLLRYLPVTLTTSYPFTFS